MGFSFSPVERAGARGGMIRGMSWQRFVDTALDRSLLGYTRVGCAVRRAWWPADAPAGALAGKVVVVTGAKAGLGFAAALGLARLGASLRLVVRGDGGRARELVRRAVPGADVTVDRCDVSLLAEVRDLAAGLGRVDVLVHNAGVMPPVRTETAEGNEVMLATHVLGPHLLTSLLRDRLPVGARVIWVASGGMYAQPLVVDDLQYGRGEYRPTTGYARTKRMQVVLARLWSQRLDGVAVHSTHPGWANTGGVATSLPRFHAVTRPLLRSPERGADTIVWLAAAKEPGWSTGLLWHDREVRPLHYLRSTYERSQRPGSLWDEVERLTR
ncbi:NAD(P)-dependent dehydrogenase, short-chain alcohol dehydrogenase family [Actinosynnema pretiosum]|nr:NAD(P)-dependent dehydrogenase, short-chain alcohol dehydrogenase family [Actinosynnema pretiosum]